MNEGPILGTFSNGVYGGDGDAKNREETKESLLPFPPNSSTLAATSIVRRRKQQIS